MVWQGIFSIITASLIALFIFGFWKKNWFRKKNCIKIFFLLYNVEAYFEGLVWDICRISDWREKEVEIIVSDAGSEDDTTQIIRRLEEKGFIKQVAREEAAKFLRSYHADEIWFFNINDKSSIKETRRALVKIFTEKKCTKEVRKSLL